MKWDISVRAILKILLAALLTVVVVKLSSLIMVVFIALLLAVTFDPVAVWLHKRGLPHWAGVLLMALLTVLSIGFVVAFAVPSVAEQVGVLAKDLPHIKESILAQLPQEGALQAGVKNFLDHPGLVANPKAISGHLLTVGGLAIGGVAEFGLLLVLAFYLMVDGKRTYSWLVAFFAPPTRKKLHQTAREVSEVIFAYVAGQAITSILVFFYALAVLSWLHVPAALILAILAGVFDILPIIGFFLSVIPAAMLALTVSPGAAGLVILFYVIYHALENYLIVPKVYGNRLRLSTLAVLLSLLAGSILAGIPGAIIVLPLVASYPILERIWLAPYLGQSVINKHSDEEDLKTG